jgi:hypothetical protein
MDTMVSVDAIPNIIGGNVNLTLPSMALEWQGFRHVSGCQLFFLATGDKLNLACTGARVM